MKQFYCLWFCRVCWVCFKLAWQPHVDGHGVISHKQRDFSNSSQYPRFPREHRGEILQTMKLLLHGQLTQQRHLAGCRTGGKRRLEGHRGRAENKHRLDPGAQESSGALLVRAGEADLLPGAAIFCQVWADSQGGLSAFSNIPTFPLPSSLAGLIWARLKSRQRAPCPALRCTDVTVP